MGRSPLSAFGDCLERLVAPQHANGRSAAESGFLRFEVDGTRAVPRRERGFRSSPAGWAQPALERGGAAPNDSGAASAPRIKSRNAAFMIVASEGRMKKRQLAAAVRTGSPELVVELHRRENDPKDGKGRNLLHHAAMVRKRSAGIIASLAADGADVDIRDRNGRTALHYAARDENYAALAALIGCGANLSLKDRRGRAPSPMLDRPGRYPHDRPVHLRISGNGARPAADDPAARHGAGRRGHPPTRNSFPTRSTAASAAT